MAFLNTCRSALAGIMRFLTLAAATTIPWTATALAAGGASTDPWGDLLHKAINFVVLVALLVYFLRKPIPGFLRKTAGEAKEQLEAAREAARKAEEELAAQKAKIAGLQQELERMVQKAREDAEAEQKLLVADAQTQAERIKSHVQAQMEQEVRKATAVLRREMAEEMVKVAEEIIKKRMDPAASSKVIDRFIQQLEGSR